MTTPQLSPWQERILQGLSRRYGESSLPKNAAAMPPDYWKRAEQLVSQSSAPLPEQIPEKKEPSFLDRITGAISDRIPDIDTSTWARPPGPDQMFNFLDRLPSSEKPSFLPDAPTLGDTLGFIYDKALRPPLERAEEVGGIAFGDIIQSVRDPRKSNLLDTGARANQWDAYLDALRGGVDEEGKPLGLDFRGAYRAYTDANPKGYDPGVIGAAEVIGDPLNLLPFGAAGKIGQGAGRIGAAARQGVGPGLRQAGEEAVAGIKGYPGAMAEEVRDMGRFAEGIGRAGIAGAKAPAYLLAGGLPGGGVPKKPKWEVTKTSMGSMWSYRDGDFTARLFPEKGNKWAKLEVDQNGDALFTSSGPPAKMRAVAKQQIALSKAADSAPAPAAPASAPAAAASAAQGDQFRYSPERELTKDATIGRGNPGALFHGTGQEEGTLISDFRINTGKVAKTGDLPGIYATPDSQLASNFAEFYGQGKQAQIYRLALQDGVIAKVLRDDQGTTFDDAISVAMDAKPDYIAIAKTDNPDEIIEVVILDPAKIKIVGASDALGNPLAAAAAASAAQGDPKTRVLQIVSEALAKPGDNPGNDIWPYLDSESSDVRQMIMQASNDGAKAVREAREPITDRNVWFLTKELLEDPRYVPSAQRAEEAQQAEEARYIAERQAEVERLRAIAYSDPTATNIGAYHGYSDNTIRKSGMSQEARRDAQIALDEEVAPLKYQQTLRDYEADPTSSNRALLESTAKSYAPLAVRKREIPNTFEGLRGLPGTIEGDAPMPPLMHSEAPGIKSVFQPSPQLEPERAALLQELAHHISNDLTIPKELRSRLAKAKITIPDRGSADDLPPWMFQAKGGHFKADPDDIQVQVMNDAGEWTPVPNWNELTSAQKRQLMGGGRRVKSRAKQLDEAYERQPKQAPPRVAAAAAATPETPQQVPTIMAARSDEAGRGLNDPIPTAPHIPPSIQPDAPDAAYRQFRQLIQEAPGDDPIATEWKALRAADQEKQQHIIEGARQVLGDSEAQRLEALLLSDVVASTPPPPLPEAASGGRGGRGGRGRRGNVAGAGPPEGPGRRPRGDKNRFGAAPVVGRVEAGSQQFDALPPMDQMLAAMRRDTRWQRLADWLNPRFPQLVRVINASGGLQGAPIQFQAQVGLEVGREFMRRYTEPLAAQLNRLGTEDYMFGLKDAQGRVRIPDKNGAPVQVLVQQIAENPKRYTLSEEQRQWIDTAQGLNQAPRSILVAHGQQVKAYDPLHSEFFVGRIILGKYDDAGEITEWAYVPITDRKGLAGRAGTTNERTYDTIEDAIADGFAPMPSYSDTLQLRIRAAARQAVNIRVGEFLAQHLKRAKAGDVPGLTIGRGNEPIQPGEIDLELLVNAGKHGVTRRNYRLAGPEAKKLDSFAKEIMYESERRRFDSLLNVTSQVSAAIRFQILTLDTSFATIQGLAALASHPTHWRPFAKALAEVLQGAWDPDALRLLRAAKIDDFASRGGLERHPKAILDFGGFSEYTEAAGLVKGLPEAIRGAGQGRGPVGAKVGAGTAKVAGAAVEAMDRASLMFDTFRDFAVLSLADLTDNAARKMEGIEKLEFVHAMDSMHNNLLGRLRSADLGISSRQRQLEAGILFLAPQYYRSTFAMYAMALEGGVRGRVARRLLAQSYGTLALVVAGLSYALGVADGKNRQQATLDAMNSVNPTSSDFASIAVPWLDMRVGLGGMFKAMPSLITDATIGEEVGTGERRFTEGRSFVGQRADTLRQFVEARSAPGVGLASDIFSGSDFIGQNTNITTPDGIRRLVTSNALPIFVQNAVDNADTFLTATWWAQASVGGLGLNTRDLGSQDIRERALRGLVAPSTNYNDAERWEQDYARRVSAPELLGLYQQRLAAQAAPVSGADNEMRRFASLQEREQSLLSIASNPSLEPYQRMKQWDEADDYARGEGAQIGKVATRLYGEFEGEKPRGDKERGHALWLAIFDNPDPQQRERLFAMFERQHPPGSEVGQYVLRMTNRRRVPLTLLLQLQNYQKAQGVIRSAQARYNYLYRKVEQEEGPEIAQQKADAYWREFFMLDEIEAAAQPQPALAAAQ